MSDIPEAQRAHRMGRVIQNLQFLQVGAKFSKKPERTTLQHHIGSLQEIAFTFIGKNAQHIPKETFHLPEDLCNELFAFLIKKKLLTAANISLILSSSQSRIDTLSLDRYGLALKEEAIQQIAIATELKGLSLRGCFQVEDSTLTKISSGCISLCVLDISCIPRITAHAVYSVTKNCKQLQRLFVEQCISVEGEVHIDSQSLQVLKIGGCNKLENVFLDNCEHLITLDIADGKMLRNLHWNCPNDPKLESLNLFRSRNLNDQSFKSFMEKAGTNIKMLNLLECFELSGDTMGQWLVHCPNLQQLVLSDTNANDATIRALADYCPLLQSLFLMNCRHITDDNSLVSLARRCTQLQSIGLPLNASDAAVVAFAENCPQLRNVDLTENKRITFFSVHNILQHCPQLYSLSLCDCQQLNDESFRIFSENSSVAQQLENINLSTVLVSDLGLSWISKACHKLSALDLTDNSAVTDTGIAHVVKGCKNLKRLYLQLCVLLTDQSLRDISAHCQALEFLDIYGVSAVTVDGAKSVIENCSALRELNVSKRLYDDLNAAMETGTVTKANPSMSLICSRSVFADI